MTEQPKRMPFSQDYEEKPAKKGVKISNENSVLQKKADEKVAFEERADKFIEQKKARNSTAVELAKQFVDFVRDKTLSENKTIIAKGIEIDLCNKLVLMALEINEDDTEREGMGSVAIINLLLKTVFIQRDIINSIDYKVVKLEKQLSSLVQQGHTKDV